MFATYRHRRSRDCPVSADRCIRSDAEGSRAVLADLSATSNALAAVLAVDMKQVIRPDGWYVSYSRLSLIFGNSSTAAVLKPSRRAVAPMIGAA
jgi:hypothetical protein